MPRRKISDEMKTEIEAMRERGLSFRQIQMRIKVKHGVEVSQGAISYHCLIAGADPERLAHRPKVKAGPAVVKRGNHIVRRFSGDEDQRLLSLVEMEPNLSEVARQLGRGRNSVIGRLATLARHDERAAAAAEREVA